VRTVWKLRAADAKTSSASGERIILALAADVSVTVSHAKHDGKHEPVTGQPSRSAD
jgi:hypothetical protein